MASFKIEDLEPVRYYTDKDPYHYTVDNRPLQDLDENIRAVAAGLSEVSQPYEEIQELRDTLSSPEGSETIGFKQTGSGSVAMLLADAVKSHVTNEMFSIPTDGIADATQALIAAEAEAYASNRILVLSGTYLLTGDVRFRRQFITVGSVSFVATQTSDTGPTVNVFFERRMNIEGIVFNYLNLFVRAKDSSVQLIMSTSFKRNTLINCTMTVGQTLAPTFGVDISENNYVWKLSRSYDALTIINVSLVNIERNMFQSYRNAVLVAPTRSFASHGVSIKDNELTNCAQGIKFQGTIQNRISDPVVNGNIISGSIKDAYNINYGSIVGLWCSGLRVENNTVFHNSDLIKIQACLDTVILHNTLESVSGFSLRASGCPGGVLGLNNMRGTNYLVVIGAATVNPIITGNIYSSSNWKIYENDTFSENQAVKIISTDGAEVRRNRFTARKAVGTNGLLWFDVGNTRSYHYDNKYYAPSGTTVRNDSGTGVLNTVSDTSMIVTPAPSVTVSAPIITEADAELNGAKSYLVTFTNTHYTSIRQMADDTSAKPLSQWMSGVTGATLAWNSSPWQIPSGRLGDIVVNGGTTDNYGIEDWWWARSCLVIDRQNRLTTRDWASTADIESDNIPPGISARQLRENAWQTAAYRPPLIVSGLAYDPVASGLQNQNEFLNSVSGRTCLGQMANGTYVLLVTDGKTGSYGAKLPQIQAKMLALGCVNAYNLDGGGSTTLWYNGAVINSPSDAGGERSLPAVMYV